MGFFEHFKPANLEKYEWSGLQSASRYIGVSVFIVVCLLIDCNNFFLKSLVWLPPAHGLLKFRIFLWGFAAIATSKEWYEYISNEHCKRLGSFAWLSFYVSLMELSAIVKFSAGQFTEPFPTWIVISWCIIGMMYLFGLFIAFKNGQISTIAQFNPYNPVVEITKHSKTN